MFFKVVLDIISMVSKPTKPTGCFESVGLWSIRVQLVGLLDWARSSRPSGPSVRNIIKRRIGEKRNYLIDQAYY